MGIDRVVKKYKLGEEPTDFTFWQSRSPQERIDALERIRKEYHTWSGNAEQGFCRVYRIIKQQ